MRSTHVKCVGMIGALAVAYLIGYATAGVNPASEKESRLETIRRISASKRPKAAADFAEKDPMDIPAGKPSDAHEGIARADSVVEPDVKPESEVRDIVCNSDGSIDVNLDGLLCCEDRATKLQELVEFGKPVYDALTSAIDAHVAEMVEASGDQIARLSEVECVLKTDEERQNHAEIISTIDEMVALHRDMNSLERSSSSQQKEADADRAEQLSQALNEKLSKERTALLYELTDELGYQGNDAQAIVDAIEIVVNATQADAQAIRATKLETVTLAPTTEAL